MKKKTVFVIGAGASKEFELPTGNELQGQIAKLVDIRFSDRRLVSGDPQIFDICKQRSSNHGELVEYQAAGWLIRDGVALTDSIDNFMDKHVTNEKVQLLGKLSIAKCIAEAERKSKLYFDPHKSNATVDFDALPENWLVKLYKHIPVSYTHLTLPTICSV